MAKGFIWGILLAAAVYAGFVGYRYYYGSPCGCGFKRDPFTGGCIVDINAGPCTGGGGGSPAGSSSGSSGGHGSAAVSPPYVAESCGLWIGNCAIRPDWSGVDFVVVNSSGTVPVGAPPKTSVTIAIREADRDGRSCSSIKGEVEVPIQQTMTVPFDAVAVAGSYPIATPSTSGPTGPGLLVSSDPACRGTDARMAVFPTRDPGCGCKQSFKRD